MKHQFLTFLVLLQGFLAHADLIVFTDRDPQRLSEATTQFKATTGEAVQIVRGTFPELMTRLTSGEQADVILVNNFVFFADLKSKGLLKKLLPSAAVQRVIPTMRAEDWVGVTFRARTLVHSKDLPANDVAMLNTYEDLANPTWEKELCLRSGTHPYSEALVAHLIGTRGFDHALTTVRGWIANIGGAVYNSDEKILEAITEGKCSIAIVNHYYLAQTLAKNSNFPVGVKFLDQDRIGVHTNGVGAGILASSAKSELAQKFIDTMLSDKINQNFSGMHFDYPTIEGLAPTTLINSWAPFKKSDVSWDKLGEFVPAARQVIKDANYK
jgi:iron(III) transport system substrate-binding protein